MGKRTDLERTIPIIDRITADLDRLSFAVGLHVVNPAILSRIQRAQADAVACRILVNLELAA